MSKRIRSLILILLMMLLARALGASSQAEVILNAQAPLLLTFDMQPRRVNTGIGPKEVLITAYLLDADHGVSGAGDLQIQFRSPSGAHLIGVSFYHQVPEHPEALIEGDIYRGLWQVALEVPRGAEAGTWEIEYLFLVDQQGNYQVLTAQDMQAFGFASTLDVTSTAVALDLPLVLSNWSSNTSQPTPVPSPTLPIDMPPLPPR